MPRPEASRLIRVHSNEHVWVRAAGIGVRGRSAQARVPTPTARARVHVAETASRATGVRGWSLACRTLDGTMDDPPSCRPSPHRPASRICRPDACQHQGSDA